MRTFVLPSLLLALIAAASVRPAPPAESPRVVDLEPAAVLRALSRGFADVSARVAPSVVTVRSGGGAPTLGSGIVFTGEGHVLTNHHVVAAGAPYRVTLSDGRTLSAQWVGSDEATDVALLRLPIALEDVPRFGAVDALRVGEWVLAVGNPYGLGPSVSAGIVSAKERAGLGLLEVEAFLQTDARIDHGNSGGALVDLEGRVVGVCAAQERDRMSGRSTLGFAVPIDVARRVAEDLLVYGRVVRGWLGVEVEELSPALARAWGLEPARALRLTTIEPGSPAAEGGLRVGDVLLRVDGRDPATPTRFARDVQARRPGDVMRFDVRREGATRRVEVIVRERPR